VPASIANLGTGFDVLAMAVDLWLEVDAQPAERPDWTFEGAQPPAGNPFERLAMRGTVRSAIPLGVGLGSSAAARVAALRLEGCEGGELLARAAAAEGHPDNVGAAIHGGMVACVGGAVVDLPAPELEIAVFVAADPSSTDAARAILQPEVSRADAVHNAGRLALLVHALHTRRWSYLRTAMDDRLHQPARLAIYPWLERALDAAYAAGALGSALAGAGPSVFAFCEPGAARAVGEAIGSAAGIPGRPLITRIATL
jgi:homoserine kinase